MQRLILFAKRPVAGSVKTRLIPSLGPEGARRLHAAFLRDQVAFVTGLGRKRSVELCLDGPWPDAPDWLIATGLTVTEQGPGDLGRRMQRAFERSHADGAECTVIIGADAPTLPEDHVERGFSALGAGAAAVVAPAEDGGYVLIGVRSPLPPLLAEVPWGGPEVMRVTRLRAGEAGIDLVELPGWYDVDEPPDLERLRDALRSAEQTRRAPATAHLLAALAPPGSWSGG